MTADNGATINESAIECDCRFLREEIERLEHEQVDLLNQNQHLKTESVSVSAVNKRLVAEVESARAVIDEYQRREEDYQEQVAALVAEVESWRRDARVEECQDQK